MALIAVSGERCHSLPFTPVFLAACALSNPNRKKSLACLRMSGITALLISSIQIVPALSDGTITDDAQSLRSALALNPPQILHRTRISQEFRDWLCPCASLQPDGLRKFLGGRPIHRCRGAGSGRHRRPESKRPAPRTAATSSGRRDIICLLAGNRPERPALFIDAEGNARLLSASLPRKEPDFRCFLPVCPDGIRRRGTAQGQNRYFRTQVQEHLPRRAAAPGCNGKPVSLFCLVLAGPEGSLDAAELKSIMPSMQRNLLSGGFAGFDAVPAFPLLPAEPQPADKRPRLRSHCSPGIAFLWIFAESIPTQFRLFQFDDSVPAGCQGDISRFILWEIKGFHFR